MVRFVQETFAQATFVHIRNIVAITDPILTKQILEGLKFLDLNIWTKTFFAPTFFIQNFLTQNFQDLNFFEPKIVATKKIWTKEVLGPKYFLNQHFFQVLI